MSGVTFDIELPTWA